MILDSPIPFREALKRHDVREVLPTNMSTAELRELDRAILDRSFFSARNLYADFLESAKRGVREILNPTTVTREGSAGASPYQVTEGTDVASVRLKLKGVLKDLGYQPEPDKVGTLQDFSSDARLNLVIKTNVEVAQGYGRDRQGQDPAVLDEWPAQELIRFEERKEKRDWLQRFRLAAHAAGAPMGDGWTVTSDGRMVALKNHPIWERLGDPALFDDGLGNPYEPFAFNSGMGTVDVSRDDAMALGLIDRDTQIEPKIGGFELAA
jgi:hypothetical protein